MANMDSSMELLDQPAKRLTASRHSSAPSFISSTKSSPPDPSDTKGLGKPTRKTYYTWKDLLMVALSLTCFFLAILAVVYKKWAADLGQKNQLIVIGFLLSIMNACLQKQAQLLLITLEAKYGASTLQNYDSILRSSMLESNVSVLVKGSLMLLFALPLGLSASYKQFVSGETDIDMKPMNLQFGPVGPPGLMNGATALAINASLVVTIPSWDNNDPLANSTDYLLGGYGFNTGILPGNVTAMLDAPLPNNLTHLQNVTAAGESLFISGRVNATIATFNSTPESPERDDPDYWTNINQTIPGPPNIASYVPSQNFGFYSGYGDQTLMFLSMWDMTQNQTFESEAIGFNFYRGQCNATWQVSKGAIYLWDVWDCSNQTEFDHPCRGRSPITDTNYTEVTKPGTPALDLLQVPLTCNMMGLGAGFVWQFLDLLKYQPVSPVWITSIASALWAQVASTHGPFAWAMTTPDDEAEWEGSTMPMLKYQSPVYVSKTVLTLHRDRWALYFVLGIQPLLLLVFLAIRVVQWTTPVSSGFGLISLMAGMPRDGADILRGAAFSGELEKPVRLRIGVVHNDDQLDRRSHGVVEYELDTQGRHGKIEKGKLYE